MKNKKFWVLYLLFATLVLAWVYVTSASLTNVPMTMSIDEMRQLWGATGFSNNMCFTPNSCPGGTGCLTESIDEPQSSRKQEQLDEGKGCTYKKNLTCNGWG